MNKHEKLKKVEKVVIARAAFESLKEVAPSKISRSFVANLAKISRSLLSPSLGKYKSKEWELLANDIEQYKTTFSTTDKSGQYRNKLNELLDDKNNFERKYKTQVEQTTVLIAESMKYRAVSDKYKIAYEDLMVRFDLLNSKVLSLEANISTPHVHGKLYSLSGSIIISPDEELLRLTGGVYKWDILSSRQAHTFARQKLINVLNRPGSKRLYVLIGRPGSGKSTWARTCVLQKDSRISIIYDATNATFPDRWEILEIAKISKDIVVCYVFFAIDVDTCVCNCQSRSNKPLSDDIVVNFTLEEPSVYEGHDELIIVKSF